MPCLPGYRYCGPFCSGPGHPTNELDTFCREHDRCYRITRNHRFCDDIFMSQLQPYLHQRGPLGRDAWFMYRAMQLKRGLGF